MPRLLPLGRHSLAAVLTVAVAVAGFYFAKFSASPIGRDRVSSKAEQTTAPPTGPAPGASSGSAAGSAMGFHPLLDSFDEHAAAPSRSSWNSAAITSAVRTLPPHDYVQLCTHFGLAPQRPPHTVHCPPGGCGPDQSGGPTPFGPYGHGEYVGHHRLPHVPQYRLRVDDVIEFVFRITREETAHAYQFNVGDELRVESVTDSSLDRSLIVQPDGTITPRLLGQVKATRRTVAQLRDELERLYGRYYKENNSVAISVTPLKVNTKLEDLRAAVDARAGSGGQGRSSKVAPDGTIALPAIGSIPAQGLTLDELKRELDERYAAEVEGMEVTPILSQRAPRYVYVVGEVRTPGRYTLEGPTTVMQAISLAGSWNVGAYLQQIVVFRRGDDWRLVATMLDLNGALRGTQPCPAGEIWLNDSDLVIVPKSPILAADDFINLVFTRGIYGVLPFTTNYQFGQLSTF